MNINMWRLPVGISIGFSRYNLCNDMYISLRLLVIIADNIMAHNCAFSFEYHFSTFFKILSSYYVII